MVGCQCESSVGNVLSSRKWIISRTGDNRGNGTIAAIRYDKGSNRDGTRL